ncbi:MAG: 4'-phosphopantetheinyl transferase superfamily protein [Clostridia bacterium]|nr:4'-phosphopantetheinyl transferase superfamily protein [Clostridia bacterium]
MVNIYCLDVACFKDEALYNSMLAKMTDERREKVKSYKFEEDGYLSLGAGYLLSLALSDAGIDLADEEIAYNEYGKPQLKSGKLHFNISHSGTIAVVATSDGEVGIDVQKLYDVDDKLIRRVTTDGEYASLCALDGDKKRSEFFRLWTAKESVIKLLGKGLSLAPSSLEIGLSRPFKVIQNCVRSSIFLHEFSNFDGYALTVASFKDDCPTVKTVTL